MSSNTTNLFVDGTGTDVPLPFDDATNLVERYKPIWRPPSPSPQPHHEKSKNVEEQAQAAAAAAACASLPYNVVPYNVEWVLDEKGERIWLRFEEQNHVAGWFAMAKEELVDTGVYPRPSWLFDNDASMSRYMDLFYPSATYVPRWAQMLPSDEQLKIVNCIRILQTCDDRPQVAVLHDHSTLVDIFNEVALHENRWPRSTVKRVRSVLAEYDRIIADSPVSAEVMLRYYAVEMGAELEKFWLFVGTRENIYWLTVKRWVVWIAPRVLHSPLACLYHKWVQDGRPHPPPPSVSLNSNAKFSAAMRHFLGLDESNRDEQQ
jgi:hypothetical protein